MMKEILLFLEAEHMGMGERRSRVAVAIASSSRISADPPNNLFVVGIMPGPRHDPDNTDLTIRSDNVLIFGSKTFTGVACRYNVSQEYITPYTPEQNDMIERFFRTAKEEVFWQYRIHEPDEAFTRFAEWIEWYDEGRPHSALGYLSPSEFRGKQAA